MGSITLASVCCKMIVQVAQLYSFIDSVSLGLRLPPSGSGCLSPEGDGVQLAIPPIKINKFIF